MTSFKDERRTGALAGQAPQEGASCLWEGALTPGRRRWLAWALQLAVALAGGWLWFGNAGAALLGLWAYLWRPAAQLMVEIRLPVHWVRLSPYAITCRCGGGWLARRTVRIYRDEMPREDFAGLRRRLKDASARQGRAFRAAS